jgi:glucosamine-6-phosphate deaminase
MEVIIRPNAVAAARLTADLIAKELKAKPGLVLGLATGCTMEAMYDRLAQLHKTEGLDFSRCKTFNLDEYAGLGADSPYSYHFFMNERFFKKVNIKLKNTHLPNGLAADFKAECTAYERKISDNGGIDLQVLGIGLNGHMGFNEPDSDFNSRTKLETLSAVTRMQNAPLFPSPDEMPRRAITMGVGTILEARECILLATGQEKAEVVARAIEGPLTTAVTASALQLHPNCTVVLDEAASSRLRRNLRAARKNGVSGATFGNGSANGNGSHPLADARKNGARASR